MTEDVEKFTIPLRWSGKIGYVHDAETFERKFDSRNSIFENCTFDDCDFKGASLRGSAFFNCTIKNTDMRRMDFENVRFIDCDIKKAEIDARIKGNKDRLTLGFTEEKQK